MSQPQPFNPDSVAPSGPRSGVVSPRAFPKLESRGQPVNLPDCVAEGTGLWRTIATLVVGILTVFGVASTFGLLLLIIPLGLAVDYFRRKKTLARLKGSCLQVSERQLPEVHRCAKEFASRLGLTEVPDIYVAESSELNAFAFRIFSRKAILLMDDVVWGALHSENPNALRFILAHELAHHAHGHTSMLRSYASQSVRPLARADELTADATALKLLGTREAVYEGLMFLTVGPQLLPYVDREALLRQSMEVGEDKNSKKAEAGQTHPLLLRRLYAIRHVSI